MSILNNHDVISSFKRKNDSNGYDDYPLSPEQRFVKALRKSNNNNLEEQFLMGVDNIITAWEENDVQREVIEYRSTEDELETDYYILDSYKYTRQEDMDTNVCVEGDDLVFDNRLCNVAVVDEALVDNQGNNFMVYDPSTGSLNLAVDYVMFREYLKYKQPNGTLVNVSTKTQSRRYLNDIYNKTVTKSIITNLL